MKLKSSIRFAIIGVSISLMCRWAMRQPRLVGNMWGMDIAVTALLMSLPSLSVIALYAGLLVFLCALYRTRKTRPPEPNPTPDGELRTEQGAIIPKEGAPLPGRTFFSKAALFLPVAFVVCGLLNALFFPLPEYRGFSPIDMQDLFRGLIVGLHAGTAMICSLLCSVLAFVRREKKAGWSLVTALPSLGFVLLVIIRLIGK